MIQDNCSCNSCKDTCRCELYPFEGIDFTAEEINNLLKSIENKVDRNEVKDGLSAYKVAVANGYQGTEEQWLASLRGAKGESLTYEDLTEEQIKDLQLPAIIAAKKAEEVTSSLVKETEAKTNSIINKSEKVVQETEKATNKLISETQKETSEAIAEVKMASNIAVENSKMQWFPNVSEEGDLSWSRSKEETPPETVNIKGPKGNDGLSGSLEEVNIVVVEDLSGGAGEPQKSYVLGASVGPELEKMVKRNTLAIGYDEKTGDFYSVVDMDDSVVEEVGMDENGNLFANFNYE